MKVKKSSSAFREEAARRLLEPIAPALEEIEGQLGAQCASFDPNVSSCVNYVAATQGKRMRPALVFYAACACSNKPLQSIDAGLVKAGLIVELVHIATLVHDDILDGATFRRSRLTATAKWGPEISVLLGDCLFAHALKLAAEFPTPFVCRRVSDATNTVCSGEILQTQRRFDLKLSREDYVKMIQMKTGALFAVSCELGAHLGGGSEREQKQLAEFGSLFGITYQIYDDIVDLVGDEAKTGKSLGTDLQKGKLTLPLLLLLEQAENGEHQVISSLLLNEHNNARGMLMDYVESYGTVKQSIQIALDYAGRALQTLKGLPDNDGIRFLKSADESVIRHLSEILESR
jgi:octaprenyl-diphosphate synthase